MTGIVAHTYPEWWLKLTGQVAHWSTDYSFTAKKLKEARMKAGFTQDEAADLMKTTKRAISQIEADKRVLSADELARFSRIYNVDVRELLFVEFTEAGDEQRLTAKYSSFLKLLEKLSDREVEDVYWVIKRKVEGLL